MNSFQETKKNGTWSLLFETSEGADLGLECLIVLAFNLKLGLEFLDQQLEASNFHAKFLQVDAGGSGPLRHVRLRMRFELRGRGGARRKSFGQGTRPR